MHWVRVIPRGYVIGRALADTRGSDICLVGHSGLEPSLSTASIPLYLLP